MQKRSIIRHTTPAIPNDDEPAQGGNTGDDNGGDDNGGDDNGGGDNGGDNGGGNNNPPGELEG